MRRTSEYMLLWTLGGTVYYGIEMVFRGYSHWSMFILGGCCLLFLALQGIWTDWKEPLWWQVINGTIFITAGEFITGLLVNKILHWNVWDYSDQPLQFWGQICVPFTILFSGLCVIGILLTGYLMHWLYGEKKPDFHVL